MAIRPQFDGDFDRRVHLYRRRQAGDKMLEKRITGGDWSRRLGLDMWPELAGSGLEQRTRAILPQGKPLGYIDSRFPRLARCDCARPSRRQSAAHSRAMGSTARASPVRPQPRVARAHSI